MKVSIISGSPVPPVWERLDPDSRIICADSGYDHCLAAGVKPDAVLGDWDSVKNPLPGDDVTFVSKNNQDDTDTYFALSYAFSIGATEVDFFSCIGDRIDHTLANISLLLTCKEKGVKAKIIDPKNIVFLMENESVVITPIQGMEGFSLLPVFDRTVSGVSIEGARYELDNVILKARTPLAVSNEFVNGQPVTLTVREGVLLVIQFCD